MKLRPLVVIDIVGLTPALLGEHTPHLNALIADGFLATLQGVFPAVTCTAQASLLTGTWPSQHGIVANGWYFRELAEVWLWRQANPLVQGEQVWEAARIQLADFTCAQLFWWYNMYASVDYAVTPRPIYPADGRKIPALYSQPPALQQQLEAGLGPFPLFNFWGPSHGHRLLPLDRRLRPAGIRSLSAYPDPGLSAPSGLQPPTPWSARSGTSTGYSADRSGRRRPDRTRPGRWRRGHGGL